METQQADTPPATNQAPKAPRPAPRGMDLLTHSRMQTARQCLKRHHYRYELGLSRASEARALRFGKAFHAGLEAWRKAEVIETAQGPQRPADEPMQAALAVYDASPSMLDETDRMVERETLASLLQGYFWRYQADDLEYLEVESKFEIPLRNPDSNRPSRAWALAGKRDGYVVWNGGEYVLETKTTSEDIGENSNYWLRWRVDQQGSLYVNAARQAGKNPVGILVDAIRKPAIRPSMVPTLDENGLKIVLDAKGERVLLANGKPRQSADQEKGYVLQARRETPEEYGERLWQDILTRPEFYYARREIPRLEDDLQEFQAEAWQQGKMLTECQRMGYWFRNVGRGCDLCEFSELCLQSVRVEPGTAPTGFVVLEDKFPELSE